MAIERHPLTPLPYRVVRRWPETDDVVTLSVEAIGTGVGPFRPGQFNMLTAFGVGEAAISISSVPDADSTGALEHTVRDVGPVSHALVASGPGAVIGVRGPFGTDWGVDDLDDQDVIVVAGGIGLAPLRGAIWSLLRKPGRTGRTVVLVGARSPDQVCFGVDLDRWRAAGAVVELTVDTAREGWAGHVGVVTSLVGGAPVRPDRCFALVCGPEIMMRFAARALLDRGVPAERVRVSLERNMQCGVGWCGHCQLGPLLVCRDGPVMDYGGRVAELIQERER